MTREQLVAFMRANPLATVATVSDDGAPQAALVGVAVSDRLELVFDTLDTSRKFQNIVRGSRVAVAFGTAGPYAAGKHDERCVQYEGIADVPTGEELARVREEIYFARFPDGRSRTAWPKIAYVRVRPSWIRFSDYNADPPEIVELHGRGLDALLAG